VPQNAREPEPASAGDAARLATLVAGDGPRVVLVHGFTQTARCWGPFADSLAADGWQLIAVDAPGHGRSSAVHADIGQGAALLGNAGGRAIYVGYSMGGRLALRLAIDRPELVRGLVLIGASPGIEDRDERAARVASDEALADRLEDIGIEKFVDEWLRTPLFASLPAERACRDERLTNSVAGLASSLRLAGTGAMDPMWPRLGELRVPVLLVTGAADTKFSAIARQIVERTNPYGWAIEVPDAGHSVHLEQPWVTAQAVTSWLRGVDLAQR
jgi:2-succinyl-6-hydroxy-2,4-cyclohexadiene-1-carboxylate synthase